MEQHHQKEDIRGQKFSPREFLVKYLRYLPWILLSIFLFVFLAYLKLRYSTDIYAVRAKMMIKNENAYGSQDRFQDLFMTSSNQNLNDEVEIMKSTALARRIVNALKLQTSYYNIGKVKSSLLYPDDSPFKMEILELRDSSQGFSYELKFINESSFNLNNNETPVYFGQVIESPFGKVRFMKQSISYTKFGTSEFLVVWSPTHYRAADIAGTFSIAPINDFSSILNITYETENPKIGRDIVNQLMQEYNDANVEDKLRITKYTLEFIDERLDTLKQELGGVEQNLKTFQERNKAIDLDQQSVITFNQLSQANEILSEQEVQLKVIRYLQDYLSDRKNNSKTVPTQLGIEEPSLQIQIQEYNSAVLKRESELKTTPAANPMIQELDARIEDLRQQIAENLKNIHQSYLINRNNLINKSRLAETEISSVPGKTQQLLEITRQRKILEDLYSFLLQKKLETSISSASTIANTKVIEPAQQSGAPVKPNGSSMYMIAFVLGLAVPIAIIFLKEILNDRIRSREDVEKATIIPILGEVGHSEQPETLVVSRNSRKYIAEQFRIIRTNLQYILNKIEQPVILITSSFSGEGKSFISTNMGAVIALSGKKTVILEFDIRKPKIVAGLDLNRKYGITNYIVGNTTISEMLLPIRQVENLFVIPCGPVPPNPAELLLDQKVKELFQQLKQQFDVIIVDSAPIGLVTDAVILSEHVDATLYIMRQDYTLKKQIGLINEMYQGNKLPKLSLILNDVKLLGANKKYGYGYGYGYGYATNYFEEETSEKNSISKFFSRFTRKKKK
jgi:capsular exopolysaccharide synthesis family protein